MNGSPLEIINLPTFRLIKHANHKNMQNRTMRNILAILMRKKQNADSGGGESILMTDQDIFRTF